MYTKDQLEKMEAAQLVGIAAELDIKVSQDDSQENIKPLSKALLATMPSASVPAL